MRVFAVFFLLVVSVGAWAQSVDKVKGSEATVNIQGAESLSVGERVSFLDEQLNISGQGEVTKVSAEGKKAIVKILSGKVTSGMGIEKTVGSSAKKSQPEAQPSVSRSTNNLTEEERKILSNGEIGTASYVIGGVLGTYPIGLGVGHAIQGRYLDKGWIFTVGELGSLAVAMAGVGDCWDAALSETRRCNGSLLFLGAMGFVGFRIWEIVDLWAAPLEINRRYRELSKRTGANVSWTPYLGTSREGVATLGLGLRF